MEPIKDFLINAEKYSIVFWFITTFFVWVVLTIQKKDVIEGLKGTDGKWEAPELIAFVIIILFIPLASYAVYFKSHDELAWYMIGAVLFYVMIGKYGLKWLLAFRAGKDKVEDDKEEIKPQ